MLDIDGIEGSEATMRDGTEDTFGNLSENDYQSDPKARTGSQAKPKIIDSMPKITPFPPKGKGAHAPATASSAKKGGLMSRFRRNADANPDLAKDGDL